MLLEHSQDIIFLQPSQVKYIPCVGFAKFSLEIEQGLLLLEILWWETGTGRDSEISQLESLVLHGSVEEDLMLMFEAKAFFMKSTTKTS